VAHGFAAFYHVVQVGALNNRIAAGNASGVFSAVFCNRLIVSLLFF
jgi:hypothetical protein